MDKNTIRKYKDSGIYRITNTVNGKIYIGSSINVYRRYKEHKKELLNNKHHNKYLQYSFNKHGRESFSFSYIELSVEPSELFNRERHYILKHNSTNSDHGYNTIIPEDDNSRREWTPELKEINRRKRLANLGIITDQQYAEWKLKRQLERECKATAVTSKEIVVVNKKTNEFITKYESIAETARQMGLEMKKISDVVNGRILSHHGYIFIEASNYDPNKDYAKSITMGREPFTLYQFNIKGELIGIYTNKTVEAAGFNSSTIRCAARDKSLNDGKYYWSYDNSIDLNNFKQTSLSTDKIRANAIKNRKYDVLVYDTDDNFICEYNIPVEAAESLRLETKAIRKVLSGERKSHKGYVFKKRLLNQSELTL